MARSVCGNSAIRSQGFVPITAGRDARRASGMVRHRMMRSEPWRLAALLLVAVLAAPAVLLAQDAGTPTGDPDAGGQAPVDAGSEGPSDGASRADELRQTAARIGDLIGGELDLTIEPAALFRADLDLADEAQVEVEARRLTLLLATATRDAGADAGAGGGSYALPDAGLIASADLWRARLELDSPQRLLRLRPAPSEC